MNQYIFAIEYWGITKVYYRHGDSFTSLIDLTKEF